MRMGLSTSCLYNKVAARSRSFIPVSQMHSDDDQIFDHILVNQFYFLMITFQHNVTILICFIAIFILSLVCYIRCQLVSTKSAEHFQQPSNQIILCHLKFCKIEFFLLCQPKDLVMDIIRSFYVITYPF